MDPIIWIREVATNDTKKFAGNQGLELEFNKKEKTA
jgi:hypothetical protein